MGTDSRAMLDAALADRQEFSAIVTQTEGMVYSIGLAFFRNRALAQDLAQDTYLDLFRNLHKLESDRHIVNWLRQAMSRKCIDYTRRKKNAPHLDLEAIPERGMGPAEPDPAMSAELRRNVADLPPKMRMVLVLRFQQDLKLREIAEVLDMPVNTAKTLLRRSLIRLRPKVAHLRTEVAYAPAGRY